MAAGVQGILCLSTEKQMGYYANVTKSGSFLSDLEEAGLEAVHQPFVNPVYLPETEKARWPEMLAFGSLPRPVLVFGSRALARSLDRFRWEPT